MNKRFSILLLIAIALLLPQVFIEGLVIAQTTPEDKVFKTKQEPQLIASKSFPSVVLLVIEDANRQTISLGSGFFVRDDIIATNLHVVEGASSGYAKIVGQEKKYDIAGLVSVDDERDLVLLSVTGTKAPSLPIGDSGDVVVGDEAYTIGNPQGLEGTFSQGIVSGIRKVGLDTLFQITAPISPGSSGGPVLNSQGKVVGVAVATYKDGQNLNFAVPSRYLLPLLSDLKPAIPLNGNAQIQQSKSIFNSLGNRINEEVIGSQFLWENDFPSGYYSFSLQNKLRESLENVHCLVVFYDSIGEPVDVDEILYNEVIPAGFARRIKSRVDNSVQEITTSGHSKIPSTKIEIRVLDFQFALTPVAVDAINKVESSVVGLYVTRKETKGYYGGSGFIVDSNGYIVTNNHLIAGVDVSIKAILSDNREFEARLIGSDPETDIAVIKIDGYSFPSTNLGNSDNVQVGEMVTAIGVSFPEQVHNITNGMVTAGSYDAGLSIIDYDDFIQTNIINSSRNSGGPLVNSKGEVVGISTAITNDPNAPPERKKGGFAIPINTARDVIDQLIKNKKVVRGWLGVILKPVDNDIATKYGLKEPMGTLILSVSGQAKEAGLKQGDLIIEFNGETVKNNSHLSRMVSRTKPDQKVMLKIIRDGKEEIHTIKLAERTENAKEKLRQLSR